MFAFRCGFTAAAVAKLSVLTLNEQKIVSLQSNKKLSTRGVERIKCRNEIDPCLQIFSIFFNVVHESCKNFQNNIDNGREKFQISEYLSHASCVKINTIIYLIIYKS